MFCILVLVEQKTFFFDLENFILLSFSVILMGKHISKNLFLLMCQYCRSTLFFAHVIVSEKRDGTS